LNDGIATATNTKGRSTASISVLRVSGHLEGTTMPLTFKIGDHVSWNSEAGHVSGIVIAVHTGDVAWKGYVHHATRDDPQYEIRSDRTDHIALHKGSALTLYEGHRIHDHKSNC
jgi:hypothetical protein